MSDDDTGSESVRDGMTLESMWAAQMRDHLARFGLAPDVSVDALVAVAQGRVPPPLAVDGPVRAELDRLQAEVVRLREENARLNGLLAAITLSANEPALDAGDDWTPGPEVEEVLDDLAQRTGKPWRAEAGDREPASEVRLTDDERRALHDACCPRHRDPSPGVYVCGPCERVGDEAVERILAARLGRREPASEVQP